MRYSSSIRVQTWGGENALLPSPLVQIHKNTSDCFYRIYLYFSTLVWYTLIDSCLTVRRTLVLMMFAHFMSSICGSWLVEMRWYLNPGLVQICQLKPVPSSYLRSIRMVIGYFLIFFFLCAIIIEKLEEYYVLDKEDNKNPSENHVMWSFNQC